MSGSKPPLLRRWYKKPKTKEDQLEIAIQNREGVRKWMELIPSTLTRCFELNTPRISGDSKNKKSGKRVEKLFFF
jgi:hypothetical protein